MRPVPLAAWFGPCPAVPYRSMQGLKPKVAAKSRKGGRSERLRAGKTDRCDKGGKIAASKQVARDPRGGGGGEIAGLVADRKARRPVDRPVLHQVEDHPGRRLAPVADLAIGRHRPLRMKRTVAEIGDMGADRR